MLFTEARFLLFFLVVFAVHWAFRHATRRKVWLLACSYLFYAAWDWRFLSLVFISTAVDYIAGSRVARTSSAPRRRAWVAFSLVSNLGLLCAFKYFDFFAESAAAFLGFLGLPVSAVTLDVVLPIGISFYTFQSLSYTIDIHRGKLTPARNLLDFALFVGFFPQLVAGPIVRASQFLPQLAVKRALRDVPFRACLTLFLAGFIKKACVADHIALLADPVFADPGRFSAATQWLAAALYGVQVYADFSGYSDMAVAAGGLLGYELPVNFDFPYLAGSLTHCWRRWHITLTTWFRDYLYIPLGGNRRGRARTYLNMVIVFLLCGLWHGASWNYVVFGLYHGIFLAGEHATGLGRRVKAFHPLGSLYTLLVWTVGLAVFRTPNLPTAGIMLRGLAGIQGGPETAPGGSLVWLGLLLGFAAVHSVLWTGAPAAWARRLPGWAFAPLFGAAAALALAFAAAGYRPFIYFQF